MINAPRWWPTGFSSACSARSSSACSPLPYFCSLRNVCRHPHLHRRDASLHSLFARGARETAIQLLDRSRRTARGPVKSRSAGDAGNRLFRINGGGHRGHPEHLFCRLFLAPIIRSVIDDFALGADLSDACPAARQIPVEPL